MMDTPEDELRVPASWHVHLDGRPGDRLTVAQADAILDDPYASARTPEDWQRIAKDRVSAAYVYATALSPDEAVERLGEMAYLGGWGDVAEQRAAGEALSVLPTDAAFEALLARATQSLHVERGADQAARNEKYFGEALMDAIARFPRRAVRILAARSVGRGKGADRHRALLRVAVRKSPEAAAAVCESLAPDAQREVRAILDAASAPVAEADDLPEVLRAPPWTRTKKKKKPRAAKLEVKPLAHVDRVVWEGDERARWLAEGGSVPDHLRTIGSEDEWRRAIDRRLREESGEVAFMLLAAPLPMARDAAARWTPNRKWSPMDRMRAIVARLELDALRAAGIYASSFPAEGISSLLPLGSSALAEIVAGALGKQTTRDAAHAWLVRHPDAAAVGLIPAAVGKDAKRRKTACDALILLARGPERPILDEVAARYGAEVVEALAPVIDADPLDEHPSRMPKMPAFWDPAILPAPELLDGRGALGLDAIETLGTMLAFSKPGAVYAGVKQVARACTPASIEAFSWALFEAWMSAGADSKDKWAFLQLGWLGGDSVAHRLAALMKDWPRLGAHKRAELGLDVLAEMESDVALILVHQMAQRAKSRSLKKNAQQKITQIAAVRRLSEEVLADRLVPDLDLDASGATVLDYGARRFRVGFDEELRPYVLEEGGGPLKNLPKPGKRDDPTKAPAAEQRFKDLKKNVRTVAKTQLERFERAMCGQRRWPVDDFARYVVAHPLLCHLARRLVWGTYDPHDTLLRTFRVAEDGSFADAADEALELPAEATVGLVHSVELSPDEAARWGEVLADYELLQPFAQIGRDVHLPGPSESRDAFVRGRIGVEIEAARILGLESRGWQRGEVGDGGYYCHIERSLPGARRAMLEFSPGVPLGWLPEAEPQEIIRVWVEGAGSIVPLDELPPVVFSELMRDVASLS